MRLSPDLIWRSLQKIGRAVSLFLLLVVTFFLQHIFEMDFVCSCESGQHVNDVVYVLFPSIILTLVLVIVEFFSQRRYFLTADCFTYCGTCEHLWCTSKCCSYFCLSFWKTVFQYIRLTALWTAMVLFDGDWYFCLKTNSNPDQTGLPCKTNLTYEEERIRDSYKTDSLDIGLGVGCLFLLLWSIVAYVVPRVGPTCCSRSFPYFKTKYEKILSEEINSYIEENLKEIAKSKAEQMCKPAIEVIKNYELFLRNAVSENDVSKVWGKISDTDFLLNCQKTSSESRPE
ncbi:hypothetical protein OJAV_G00210060 [Oryzias javanicus]|uniref:Uncharacterized protein n=1 Tax=Oryzias javanicus TaxID=123683 RepID=A0A3S2NSV9_ORYJA|nr:hypothetical protein OJAV_G00210060 [Oryzias javanicus]